MRSRRVSAWRFRLGSVVLGLVSIPSRTRAFTPAQPSNLTAATSADTGSTLQVFWYPNAVLTEPVNYQLAATGLSAKAIAKAPIVQFDQSLDNGSTTTPWVAFLSCDSNQNSSSTEDVFNAAWEQGAIAALLYSNTSQTCAINLAYVIQDALPRHIPVFSALTKVTTALLFSQFANATNASYTQFDATFLNASNSVVESAIQNENTPQAGFFYAILNGSVPYLSSGTNTTAAPSGNSTTVGGSSSNGTTASNVTSTPSDTSDAKHLRVWTPVTGLVAIITLAHAL